MDRTYLVQGQDDLGHLARHMNDLMHKVMRSGFSPGGKPPDWTPAIDVCEMDDSYEVIVDLAGVRREQIEVYTEEGYLAVAGCREDPTSPGKRCLHQMEIEQGRFRRRIKLPCDAEAEAVSARYSDGLLHIRVPKRTIPTP